MKTRIVLLAFLLVAGSCGLGGSSPKQPPQTGNDRVTGVWRAQMDGLPAIALTVTDEGDGLSGAVLFYFHKRDNLNETWVSTPGLPEPIFNLKFDGKTIAFQVSHRRAHPPRTLSDPPVHFHLTLTGPNKAEIVNENENEGPALVMIRSDY